VNISFKFISLSLPLIEDMQKQKSPTHKNQAFRLAMSCSRRGRPPTTIITRLFYLNIMTRTGFEPVLPP
jgi:hypothetical protein